MCILDKSSDQLETELFLKKLFLQSHDPEYSIPHPYTYYEDTIRQAVRKFPASLTLQKCAPFLNEDTFIENGADTVIHRHLSFFPPIWHSNLFFSIQIVVEGSLRFHIANQKLILKKGDVCIVAPESRHAISCFSDDANVICALIRRSTFEEAFFGILEEDDSILADFFRRTLYDVKPHSFLHFKTGWDPELMKILENACLEEERPHVYRRQMLNSLFHLFFITLLRNHGQDVILEENSPMQQNQDLIFILKYMQEHYKTVTLSELASFFNYSERQVQRLLKKGAGISFMETIQTIRMREAARLLVESGYSVSRIAEETGYHNMGNFRKIFFKTYQKSPMEYRKEFHQNLQ